MKPLVRRLAELEAKVTQCRAVCPVMIYDAMTGQRNVKDVPDTILILLPDNGRT